MGTKFIVWEVNCMGHQKLAHTKEVCAPMQLINCIGTIQIRVITMEVNCMNSFAWDTHAIGINYMGSA